MQELVVFSNEKYGEIRTIENESGVWFVAADVCKALEIADTGRAIERLDGDESTRIEIDHPQSIGKKLTVWAVNEYGLYGLVLGSRKKEAKEFKRWITHEVLPSIRKTGGYQMKPQMPVKMSDVFQAMAQTARLAEEASDTANNALKSISLLSAAQEVMDKKLTATADVLAAPSPADDVWQTETKKAVTRIVEAQGFGYQRYWQELYEKLEQRAGANLETRQNNLKSRLKKQGATAAEINNVSKLNVIARDKKLRDIFTNIIQREQARHILKGA